MNSKSQVLSIPSKALILAFLFTSCHKYGNSNNPLCGIVFSDLKEVHQFQKFDEIGGGVLDIKKGNDFEFGIIELSNKKQNILVLDKLITQKNSNDVKYQILDTINVIPKKNYIQIGMCRCFENSTYNPTIGALIFKDILNDSTVSVQRAWKVDTESGKLNEIKNTKNVHCDNMWRGMKGE